MKEYKLSYGIFHWLVHFSLMLIAGYLLGLGFTGYLILFFATIVIDFDHLPVLRKKGVFGYLKSLKFSEARYYPLHRIHFLVLFLLLTLVSKYLEISFLTIFFVGVVVHMVWDFSEDVFIFRIGIKNWKV